MVYTPKNAWSLSTGYRSCTQYSLNAYENLLDIRNRRRMSIRNHKNAIDEHFVKTFDMKTFPVSMAFSGRHMIAGDCSETSTFAVLVKPVRSRRAACIITSTRIIDLFPSGIDFYQHVDKKDSRRLPVGSLKILEADNSTKETEIRILKTSNDLLEVFLPLYIF